MTVMQGEFLASQGKFSCDLEQKPYEGFVQRLLPAMPLPCACQDGYQLWGLRAETRSICISDYIAWPGVLQWLMLSKSVFFYHLLIVFMDQSTRIWEKN